LRVSTAIRNARVEPLTPLERILVVMVVIVVTLFEVWFFFLAGSPLPKQ
jgi:hypothetical protein